MLSKVTSFLISESIKETWTEESNKTTIITGPTVALRPINIPSNFSFGITFTLQGEDCSKSISFGISIIDPKGIVIEDSQELNFENPNDVNEDTMPLEYSGATINLSIDNFPFEMEGCYKICIYQNGNDNIIYEHELPVYKR